MIDVQYPKVGVGILIMNDQNEILLGERIGSHGEGLWCYPGGHLEWGEKIEECAKREVKEETGLDVDVQDVFAVTDDLHWLDKNKHYITVAVRANYLGGEPNICEPNKCREWRWFHKDALPENLFEPSKNALHNLMLGSIYIS